MSFPTITIGAGNGNDIVPSVTASKDEVSKGLSSILNATGATVVTASNSDFSQTSIAIVISQGVTTLQAALATSGLPIGFEQTAPFIVAQSSSLVTVSSANNGGASTPATAVPALATSVSTTSELSSEVEQTAPFIVAQSPSLALVSTGNNEGASISGLTPIAVANSANLPVPQITSLAGDEVAGTQGSAPAAIASSQTAASIGSTGTTEASGFSIAAPSSLVLESGLPAPTNVPTTGTIETVPSSLVIVAGAPFISTTAVSEAQSPTPAQIAATILTPVVGANGLTSLAVVPSPNELTSYATAPTPTEAGSNLASPTGAATPVLGFNGLTSLAVIPSPVVGANGLTSLAVFSTPIAAANGLTLPAVILTPVVGANGLTSLAVLATPVVGANGLTSLAIGLASELSATIAQPNVTPAPIEESTLIASPAAPMVSQVGIPAPPLVLPPGASNIVLPPGSAVASFGNASVHVLLNPTAIAEFQGSAVRLPLGCGIGLISFLMFLLFL